MTAKLVLSSVRGILPADDAPRAAGPNLAGPHVAAAQALDLVDRALAAKAAGRAWTGLDSVRAVADTGRRFLALQPNRRQGPPVKLTLSALGGILPQQQPQQPPGPPAGAPPAPQPKPAPAGTTPASESSQVAMIAFMDELAEAKGLPEGSPEREQAELRADKLWEMIRGGGQDAGGPEQPGDAELKQALSRLPAGVLSFTFMQQAGGSDGPMSGGAATDGGTGNWTAFHGPRGGTGWKNTQTGRVLYTKSPNPPGHMRRQQKASAGRAEGISKRVLAHYNAPQEEDAPSEEELHELATHLPALTRDQLHLTRNRLLASWGDAPRKEHMVAALRKHVADLVGTRQQSGGKLFPNHPGRDAQAELDAQAKAKRGPRPGSVSRVPLASLHVDPERFQFKQNVDKAGVTDELKGVKQWNPDLAGVLATWHDPETGKEMVVNGHHRYELAGRTGQTHVNVRRLNAANHVEARAKGALINIAEGRGTPLDAAKFMRDMKLSPEDLAAHGVSLKGSVARDAAHLKNLSDPLFHAVARGQLDTDRAVQIGAHLANKPDLQNQLHNYITRREEATGREWTPKMVAEAAREMASAPTHTKDAGGLFGGTEESSRLEERAALKAHVRGALATQRRDFEAVGSERRAGNVQGAGNVLNVQENQRLAKEHAQAAELFDRTANLKGPVADLVNDYAEKYADAPKQKRAQLQSELTEHVRKLLAGGPAAVGAPAEPERPAADGAGVAGAGAAGAGGAGAPATERGGAAGDGGGAQPGVAGGAHEPAGLTAYHGTNQDFKEFDDAKAGTNIDSGWLGRGHYFTDNPETAGYYANIQHKDDSTDGNPVVHHVNLDLKKPFDWGQKNHGVRGEVYGTPSIPPAIRDAVYKRAGLTPANPEDEPNFANEPKLSQALRDELIARGHDGVTASLPNGQKELVAFHGHQAKITRTEPVKREAARLSPIARVGRDESTKPAEDEYSGKRVHQPHAELGDTGSFAGAGGDAIPERAGSTKPEATREPAQEAGAAEAAPAEGPGAKAAEAKGAEAAEVPDALKPLHEIAARAKRYGGGGLRGLMTHLSKPQLDAIDKHLVDTKHPSANEPGTQMDRAANAVREIMEGKGLGAPAAKDHAAEEPLHVSPGYDAHDAEIERKSQEYARTNYADIKAKYLAENGTPDPAGGFKSVVMNTDEFRHHLPGYEGTNAHAVHEAASYLNKRMFREALAEQKGKGNGRLMVLAGGGGSGKGSATRDHFQQSNYPLVLDQVTDSVKKFEQKMAEAKAHGYTPEYVYVDRHPKAAFEGVVGRSVNLRRKGQPARTVALEHALKANVAARKAALEILKKHVDVPASVVDNNQGPGAAKLITDRAQAIQYLEQQIAAHEGAHEQLHKELHENVLSRHAAGEIPTDIAHGLVGKAAVQAAATNPKEVPDDGATVPGPGAVPADHAAGVEAPAAAHAGRDEPRLADGAPGARQEADAGPAGPAEGAGGEGPAPGGADAAGGGLRPAPAADAWQSPEGRTFHRDLSDAFGGKGFYHRGFEAADPEAAAGHLKGKFPTARHVHVGDALEAHLKTVAGNMGVKPGVLERALAEGPGGKDWDKVQRLVRGAHPELMADILGGGESPVIASGLDKAAKLGLAPDALHGLFEHAGTPGKPAAIAELHPPGSPFRRSDFPNRPRHPVPAEFGGAAPIPQPEAAPVAQETPPPPAAQATAPEPAPAGPQAPPAVTPPKKPAAPAKPKVDYSKHGDLSLAEFARASGLDPRAAGKAHREAVVRRITSGRPVHPSVKRDYPEVVGSFRPDQVKYLDDGQHAPAPPAAPPAAAPAPAAAPPAAPPAPAAKPAGKLGYEPVPESVSDDEYERMGREADARAKAGTAKSAAGQKAKAEDWYPRFHQLQNQADRFKEEGRTLNPKDAAELGELRKKLDEFGGGAPAAGPTPPAFDSPAAAGTPGLTPWSTLQVNDPDDTPAGPKAAEPPPVSAGGAFPDDARTKGGPKLPSDYDHPNAAASYAAQLHAHWLGQQDDTNSGRGAGHAGHYAAALAAINKLPGAVRDRVFAAANKLGNGAVDHGANVAGSVGTKGGGLHKVRFPNTPLPVQKERMEKAGFHYDADKREWYGTDDAKKALGDVPQGAGHVELDKGGAPWLQELHGKAAAAHGKATEAPRPGPAAGLKAAHLIPKAAKKLAAGTDPKEVRFTSADDRDITDFLEMNGVENALSIPMEARRQMAADAANGKPLAPPAAPAAPAPQAAPEKPAGPVEVPAPDHGKGTNGSRPWWDALSADQKKAALDQAGPIDNQRHWEAGLKVAGAGGKYGDNFQAQTAIDHAFRHFRDKAARPTAAAPPAAPPAASAGDQHALARKLATGGTATPEEAAGARAAYQAMSEPDQKAYARALGHQNIEKALPAVRDELVDRTLREGEFRHAQAAKGLKDAPDLHGGALFAQPGVGESGGLFDDFTPDRGNMGKMREPDDATLRAAGDAIRRTVPAQKAADLSHAANDGSEEARRAAERASNALAHASAGRADQAIEAHQRAAYQHTKAMDHYRQGDDDPRREAHGRAAMSHAKAAEAMMTTPAPAAEPAAADAPAEEPIIYEQGGIRDLIRDARVKYDGVDAEQLRRRIHHDTAYLDRMDMAALKGPAHEARVPHGHGIDPEKVRKGIRDVIQAAVAPHGPPPGPPAPDEHVNRTRELQRAHANLPLAPADLPLDQSFEPYDRHRAAVDAHVAELGKRTKADVLAHAVAAGIEGVHAHHTKEHALTRIRNHLTAHVRSFERNRV